MDIYLDHHTIRNIRHFLKWLGDPYLLAWWKVFETFHWPRWRMARVEGWSPPPDFIITLFGDDRGIHIPAFSWMNRMQRIEQ